MQATQHKFAPIIALLLLSLLWAADSVHSDLVPVSIGPINLPALVREALLLALFSILAALAASIRKSPLPRKTDLNQAILTGVCLFVLPPLLIETAKPWVSDYTRIALLSLTPLFAVVFDPYLGAHTQLHRRGEFAAALIAVAGSALVFPIEIPESPAALLAFCGVLAASVSIAAGNCIAVRGCRQSGVSVLTFSAVSIAFASCSLAVLGLALGRGKAATVPIDAWTVLDLLPLALLFWLMNHMSAVRMTTRFLIAPLLANLAGLALIRPHLSWQSAAGLLLIALASAWLLFAPHEPSAPNETLLKLD